MGDESVYTAWLRSMEGCDKPSEKLTPLVTGPAPQRLVTLDLGERCSNLLLNLAAIKEI